MNKDNGNGFLEIQGIKCFLPKRPLDHEIMNYGKKKKDQKWYRTELPVFKPKDIEIWDGSEYESDDIVPWHEAVRQEKIKITGRNSHDLDKNNNPKQVHGVEADPEYFMDCVEAFRSQELDRVKNGVWIFINGNAYYIPGTYYFYLNYWPLKDCYAEFRYVDLELFYVWEHVRKSKNFLGLVYITQRGVGKSFVAGSLMWYETTIRRKSNTTVQSKRDEDAENFFRDQVMVPASSLPEFLIPINKYGDISGFLKDVSGLGSIEFSPPAMKSMNVKLYNWLKKEALYSKATYTSSGEFAADRGSWDLVVQEEIGKTPPDIADVYKRIMVNKFTVFRGNKKTGNIFASSTVEEMKNGGAECLKIWNESDQNNLGEINTTNTGLVRFFRSALDVTFFDEFGFSCPSEPEDKETKKYLLDKYGEACGEVCQYGARAYHDAKRKALEHDQQGLISYIQKNPYNEKEAFWINADKCVYNAAMLFQAKEKIMNAHPPLTRRGDIVWKVIDKEAEWVDNHINGKWEVSFFNFEPNKVKVRDGHKKTFSPMMGHKRVMALDPYSNADIVDEKRGSKAAACVYNKFDFHTSDDYNDTIIADYLYRHDDPFKSYEDIICACFWFGCPVLIELNKSNAKDYFRQRGYAWGYAANPDDFMMERPESTLTQYGSKITDGVTSSVTMIDHYVNSTARHINEHGKKLKHIRPIEDWLKFNPADTRRYDMAVAASYSIVAAEKKMNDKTVELELGSIFKTYNNKGSMSQAN